MFQSAQHKQSAYQRQTRVRTKLIQENVTGLDGEKFWKKMRQVPNERVCARFALTENVAAAGESQSQWPISCGEKGRIAGLTDRAVEDVDRVEDGAAVLGRRREGSGLCTHIRACSAISLCLLCRRQVRATLTGGVRTAVQWSRHAGFVRGQDGVAREGRELDSVAAHGDRGGAEGCRPNARRGRMIASCRGRQGGERKGLETRRRTCG